LSALSVTSAGATNVRHLIDSANHLLRETGTSEFMRRPVSIGILLRRGEQARDNYDFSEHPAPRFRRDSLYN